MDAAAVAEHLRALGIECLTEDLEPYGRDETMDLFHAPELVVRPRSTPDVQEVLRLADREGIPVTPRGGGTGKAGGCIPVAGGIVLTRTTSMLRHTVRSVRTGTRRGFPACQPEALVEDRARGCAGRSASRGDGEI